MTNKTIGQATGHTDTAEVKSVVVADSITAVKILDEEVLTEGQHPQRMLIAISVLDKDTFIKLQPAATDNDQKGIYVLRSTTLVIEPSAMYFGEISAIATNATARIYVTVL